ncbi:LOW QUALITY PROTEIN: RPE65 domain-containing protein, partial [Cephalotus follicularis]
MSSVSQHTIPPIMRSRESRIHSHKHTIIPFINEQVASSRIMALQVNDGGAGGRIEAVNPKAKRGLASQVIDLMEKLIVKLMYDSSLPLHYLSSNFAPAPCETPPTNNLPLIGCLPECLNGAFFRVGPNPKFAPVAGYHWFDGDGMVHGLRIKDGKATYVSRYVGTSRIKQEDFFDGSKFFKADLAKLSGLGPEEVNSTVFEDRLRNVELSMSPANTNLIYHHGKLLALSEMDKPYVLKVLEDGDLRTLGLLDYDKRLKHSFTAHPKVDPITGEMFTFGFSRSPPYITYRVISKDGFMHDPVPITVSGPIMMHDFAITENYAIFLDLPFIFRPKEMVMENQLIFTFNATKKACFGVLPRYAKNEAQIRWFELPNCFIFHNANAWEEGEEVVLITCRMDKPLLDMANGAVKEKLEDIPNELYEMRFNMKTGLASQKKLSESAVDFPAINKCYSGRKQRYVYGTILDSLAKVKGFVKFDLHAEPEAGKTKIEVGGNVKGVFDLGPGRFGSEAVFVPREPGTSEEDDGYLIHFVHDESTGKSSVNVICAKTMSTDPVAVVELPTRVPYGFHALFVTE